MNALLHALAWSSIHTKTFTHRVHNVQSSLRWLNFDTRCVPRFNFPKVACAYMQYRAPTTTYLAEARNREFSRQQPDVEDRQGAGPIRSLTEASHSKVTTLSPPSPSCNVKPLGGPVEVAQLPSCHILIITSSPFVKGGRAWSHTMLVWKRCWITGQVKGLLMEYLSKGR